MSTILDSYKQVGITNYASLGGGKHIWANQSNSKEALIAGGVWDGNLTSGDITFTVGSVIPAGTPVYLNEDTRVLSIVKCSDATVNGLLGNDIFVPADFKTQTAPVNYQLTGDVVWFGSIYENRLPYKTFITQAFKDNLVKNGCFIRFTKSKA